MLNNTGSQLSLFNDSQVRRSFLCRFTKNPTKEFIDKMRPQNLFSVPLIGRKDEISYISFTHHMNNRHNLNVTKIKQRYFYD